MVEKLTAQARFKHEGRDLHTGEEFETDEADADDLVAMGMATRLSGMTRALNAALDVVHPQARPRRQQYSRRDLKPEDKTGEVKTEAEEENT